MSGDIVFETLVLGVGRDFNRVYAGRRRRKGGLPRDGRTSREVRGDGENVVHEDRAGGIVAHDKTLGVAGRRGAGAPVGERPRGRAVAAAIRIGDGERLVHEIGIGGERDRYGSIGHGLVVALEHEFAHGIRVVGAHDHVIIAADPIGDGDRGSRDRVEGRGVERPGVRENAELDIVAVAVNGIRRQHHAIDPRDGRGREVAEVVDAETERGGVAALQAGGRRRREACHLQVRERDVDGRHDEHIQNIFGIETAGEAGRSHQGVIGAGD